MKVYNILYNNEDKEGTAIVQSNSAYEASVYLQSKGTLNSGRYKCTSIKEIGCNNSNQETILSESYGEPIIQNIEPPKEEKPNVSFDINKLTESDIKSLKLRIDKYSDTIKVDRIGKVCRINPNKGYTVFCTFVATDSIKKELYHLYYYDGNDYIDLGIPYNKFIRDSKRVLRVINDVSLRDKEEAVRVETILDSRKKKYGIFILQKCSHIVKSYNGDGTLKKRFYRYKFIKLLDNFEKIPSYTLFNRLKIEAQKFIAENGYNTRYRLYKPDTDVGDLYIMKFAIGEVTGKRYIKYRPIVSFTDDVPEFGEYTTKCTRRMKGLPIMEKHLAIEMPG